MYYVGIGSRNTPEWALRIIRGIGKFLAEHGHILRSGAADGADEAFEYGCNLGKGKKEIYLPWRGFNGSQSSLY